MMKPQHEAFEVLEQCALAKGQKVLFISERTPDRSKIFSWIPLPLLRQIVYQSIKALDMAIEVLTAKDAREVILYEHKPQYCLPLYLALLLRGSHTAFFVHGLQQIHSRSIIHHAGLLLIQFLNRHCNFIAVHIELNDHLLDQSLQFREGKTITVPHPLPDRNAESRRTTGRFQIGVVGLVHKDKPIAEIIRHCCLIQNSRPDIEFTIGTPKWQMPEWIAQSGATIVDTSEKHEFYRLLASLDVLVADFDRDNFFFRPSGIINDAISQGCRVITRNFPVIAAQATRPVVMGRFFDSYDEIPALVDSMKNETDVERKALAWRKYRDNMMIFERIHSSIRNPPPKESSTR